MDLRTIQAGGGGAVGVLARAGLTVLSWPFAAAARVRTALYDARVLAARRVDRAVVSVGNLTAGGTGKTPFVAWLARAAIAAGRRPGILARGYGPTPEGATLSDEGTLLAELLGHAVPQVEDPRRIRGARALFAAHPDVDLVLLDDGFQHRRLARDVDVVLLDATNPFGFRRPLPRGLLREPAAALARAHVVVLTRAERVDAAAVDALRREVAAVAPAAHVAVARTRARALVLADGRERPPSTLVGLPVLAWAGIGNPGAFEGLLADLGARAVARVPAADHHRPSAADLDAVRARATAAGASLVVVTRKDLVKLRPLLRPSDPVAALDVDTDVVDGREPLLRVVLAAGRPAAGA